MPNAHDKTVPHPRYGVFPILSDDHEAVAIARKRWGERYWGKTVFPESAILADPEKQNYSVIPRVLYVDMKKTCRDCGRSFIFFAKEQKYWYEKLKFTIDADCVRCPECRRSERTLRRRFDRYSQSVISTELDDAAFATLIDDALFLWEHDLLKNKQKLFRLRKLARTRIPDHKATMRLESLLEALSSKGARPPKKS